MIRYDQLESSTYIDYKSDTIKPAIMEYYRDSHSHYKDILIVEISSRQTLDLRYLGCVVF